VFLPRTAHIISTLKRPEEVDYLRRIYGAGFFLIGVSSSKTQRHQYFREICIAEEAIDGLISTDQDEQKPCGQQTRETFYLADVFVSMDDYGSQISRFLDLLFGCPFHTPTADEHGMFLAYAASLRSGDLSRQVGAAIVDTSGDLLSVGCNEVPKYGGGTYGPEKGSHRDIETGFDSNEREKFAMAQKIATVFGKADQDHASLKKLLKSTGFFDITELGRSVHAEMEALLACARSGRSPRGATLLTTTFPCHNCTRHIIDAGISRVCYIEPYAKSKAPDLHDDAICIDEVAAERLPFMAFVGVGPRRYFDLFSLKLSSGYPIERKADGTKKSWERASAPLRLQLQPTFYLRREILAWRALAKLLA
jgi:deoxycytidylate deaminase